MLLNAECRWQKLLALQGDEMTLNLLDDRPEQSFLQVVTNMDGREWHAIGRLRDLDPIPHWILVKERGETSRLQAQLVCMHNGQHNKITRFARIYKKVERQGRLSPYSFSNLRNSLYPIKSKVDAKHSSQWKTPRQE